MAVKKKQDYQFFVLSILLLSTNALSLL